MSPAAQIAALSGAALLLVGLGIWIAFRVHGTPEKRERRRRLAVNAQGRLGDALITEAADGSLYYSYDIRGVHYTASQDISALHHLLPAEPHRLLGNAGLKYSPRNPANSILICEEWSGLRAPARNLNPADQPAPQGKP